MNLYYDHPDSRGISRVINNLEKYIPKGITLSTREDADLIVLHVVGRNVHITAEADAILKSGKQYAVIQYAWKSTRNPEAKDWEFLWNNAKFVWSYYDLREYVNNFYHAPISADPEIFFYQPEEQKYMVGTLGDIKCYKVECFGEVHLAAYHQMGKVVHVGKPPYHNPIVDYVTNISDDDLRKVYNQCKWFSSLRRKDGFELPAVEALLCGTRPIMFDTPNYRQWFDGLAEFIPEGSIADTVYILGKIFKSRVNPVGDADLEETKKRFNWEQISKGFWERCTS
jgi:hypothetical protein